MDRPVEPSDQDHSFIILYDGVCGLCNRLNRFVINRDPEGRFRFASLQSEFAREALAKHNKTPSDLSTLYLIVGSASGGQRLLSRASAVICILSQIGGIWRLATTLAVVPLFVLDFGYNLVAKNRYRLFGKHTSCPLPEPELQSRFLTKNPPS